MLTEYEKGYAQAVADIRNAYRNALPQGQYETFNAHAMGQRIKAMEATVTGWEK